MMQLPDLTRSYHLQHLYLNQYKRWVTPIVLFLLFLCLGNSPPCFAIEQPSILILNSYHEGYSWSDDLLSGIKATIRHQFPEAQISVEYLDTKRNNSAAYLQKITALFEDKYHPGQFDLLMATDDNGIGFALEHRPQLFGNTPLVFCGANTLDTKAIEGFSNITGVLEHSDIRGTIALAKKLLPATDTIYVVNDKTTTGINVGKMLTKLLPELEPEIELHFLDDLPLEELTPQIQQVDGNSIILLLAYLRDKNGVYYAPKKTAGALSQAAKVPIFSVWDFFFNHGILGGVITSGHLHGEAAGELAIRILKGAKAVQLPIIVDGGNRLLIDYSQLQRYDLDEALVPRNATVKNITYHEQKNVLVLLSYSLNSQWNQSVLQGIKEQFAASGQDIRLSTEFMDTKRFSDRAYQTKLVDLYQFKYKHQKFDAVLVSDDNGFKFIQRNRNILTPGVPIIFCGVNYLPNPHALPQQEITGVVESYDIGGTIALGMELFPDTKKLFVINDRTTTGIANDKKLQIALGRLQNNLQNLLVEHCGEISMQELLVKVADLEQDTLILLMSFTMDRHNQRFSYDESMNLIYGKATRPILGFWDFYVNQGIVGGAITSGKDQGRTAAAMTLDILRGKPVAEIPVLEFSPVQPTIDYQQLSKFEWHKKELPATYTILNHSYSLFERYRNQIYFGLAFLTLLFLLVLIQAFKIMRQNKEQLNLSEKAATDALTGAKNRSFFLEQLQVEMEKCVKEGTSLVLCYFDIDNLKTVNDTYGHAEGDAYILHVTNAIRKFIRENDILGRIGGDEFVVILAGRSEAKTTRFANEVNTELKNQKMLHNIVYPLSVSYGFSSFSPASQQTPKELLQQADQQMYLNKQKKKT